MEEGQEVYIYSDPQTETKLLGKVKLLSFIREGLPFILQDMSREQIYYYLQYWKCEVLISNYYPKGYIKTFPVKQIYKEAIIDINDDENIEVNFAIIDKFIEVNGEEIY